jgi:hypothetical protein
MSFPWLVCTPPRPDGAERRTNVALAELASRAGVLYRLGFSQTDAAKRLTAAVAWEYDSGAAKHPRPAALSDQAISKVVSETFARRPA